MNNWNINRTVDLDQGHGPVRLLENVLAEYGDKLSHSWNVTVNKNYIPVSLTGATVYGYFVRADNVMVAVQGSASGNVATVVTDQSCFAVPGELVCKMQITLNGATFTLDAFKLDVRNDASDEVVDPGEVIPSLQDIFAAIDDMEAAAAAAESAASHSVVYDTAQSLTAQQKARAQANIGLIATDDGEGNITIG